MKISCELLGTSFELVSAPQRIVSLVSAATETVAELGARELLVGVSPYCSRYVDGLAAPVVGDYVRADVGALRAIAPDLVLLTSGVQLPLARRCAAAGLPAYVLPVPSSRFGILENIVAVGALIGRTAAARALADRMAAGLEALRAAPRAARPRIYAELWFGRHPRTTGGRTFVHDLIEVAGGDNVFGALPQGYLPLDLPAAAAARPDVLLLFSEPEFPVDAELLVAERGWALATDVRTIVSTVDRGRNLIHDGPSFIETARWLGERLQAAR
jgi:iron complex transport system substrate-binding protein